MEKHAKSFDPLGSGPAPRWRAWLAFGVAISLGLLFGGLALYLFDSWIWAGLAGGVFPFLWIVSLIGGGPTAPRGGEMPYAQTSDSTPGADYGGGGDGGGSTGNPSPH